MKKLALLLSLCVMVLAVSTTAFAGEIEIDQVGEVITITGSQFESGKQIGIVSLKPGVDSLNNINVDEPIESIDYIDQVETDENGGFTLTFTSSGEQGVYKVYYTGKTDTPGGTYEINIDGEDGAISGKITSAATDNSSIEITVKKGDTVVTTANPNVDGTFLIEGLAADTYSVVFEKRGHLKLTINNVVVTESETKELGDKKLLAGNVNGDRYIDFNDLMAVVNSFNTKPEDSKYKIEADFDEDNKIDFNDLMRVVNNFNTTEIVEGN